MENFLHGLFVSERRAKYRRFVESFADELEGERQIIFRDAAGNGNARQARQVHGHGANVLQIHLERVRNHLADFERDIGRGRRED